MGILWDGVPDATDRTYAELLEELRPLGRGVLGEHIISGTLKSCSSTAPFVQLYLAEKGWTVSKQGAKKYGGHYDLSVKTSDKGWVAVDPTYMQFRIRYWFDDETDDPVAAAESILPLLYGHFRDVLQDGLTAFEITTNIGPRDVSAYEPVPDYFRVKDWTDYWAQRSRLVDSIINGTTRKFDQRLAQSGYGQILLAAARAKQNTRRRKS